MPVRATHTGQMNDSVVLHDFFFFFFVKLDQDTELNLGEKSSFPRNSNLCQKLGLKFLVVHLVSDKKTFANPSSETSDLFPSLGASERRFGLKPLKSWKNLFTPEVEKDPAFLTDISGDVFMLS